MLTANFSSELRVVSYRVTIFLDYIYLSVCLFIVCVSVCICSCSCITAHVWRSESNLPVLIPSFYHVGPGTECRPSDLAVSIVNPFSHLAGAMVFDI